MKKILLKAFMLLCLILWGGVSSAWADTATLSISSGFTSNGNLNDNQSNSWAITSDGSYTSSNSYIQVGTNKSEVTYLKLSTSAYSTKYISKIQVWGTSKANSDVTAKVSIGDNLLGESEAYTTQNASSGGTEFSVNNTNGYMGDVLIEISRPTLSTGAIYFNKLIITYTDVLKPEHTAHFSVNGVVNDGDDCVAREDNAITFPSDPADINGKKFQGWTKTADYSNATTAPSDLCKSANMGTADVTYYAVFASVDEDEEIVETVGFESAQGYTATSTYNSSNYTTGSTGSKWTINYGAFATSGAIAGSQSAQFRIYSSGGGFGQLRNTVAYENDITTISFKAKTANTNGKVKVSYSTDGTNWTDIETLSLTTTTTSYNEEIPVTGVRYIKFTAAGTKPSSGNYSIYVDDIKIQTLDKVVTDYCTTVASTATINLNAACHDEDDMVYGTYSNSSAWVVPGDIVVSVIAVEGENLLIKSFNTGDVVPANTGVLVSAIDGGNYVVNLSNEAGVDPLEGVVYENALRATGNGISAEQMAAADPDKEYFRLTMHNGTDCGFWWGAENGAAFALGANKAYLVADHAAGSARGFSFSDNSEALESIEMNAATTIYTLNGVKVNELQKGLNIVNGKKVMVK